MYFFVIYCVSFTQFFNVNFFYYLIIAEGNGISELFRFHHVHCTVLRGQRTNNTITEKVREQDLKLLIVLRLDPVLTDLKL